MSELTPFTPQENNLHIPQEMYEISGQDKITEHSLNRYLKDKEQDEAIINCANEADFLNDQIRSLDNEKLIAAEDKSISIIRAGLNYPDIQIQEDAAKVFWRMPENVCSTIFDELLSNSNIDSRVFYVLVLYADPKNRAPLIEKCLKNSNDNVRIVAAHATHNAPVSERPELLLLALNDSSPQIRAIAANEIQTFQTEKMFEETRTGKSDRPDIQHFVTEKILNDLRQGDFETQLAAAEMIYYAERDSREWLESIISQCAEYAIYDTNLEVVLIAAKMIGYGSTYQQEWLRKTLDEIIQRNLANPDLKIQKDTLELIQFASPEKKDSLLQMAIDQGLSEELVAPPIYNGTDLNSVRFSKHAFKKTGSGTTLIGGDLKNKSIIRHITPSSFLTWQQLFEDYTFWQENNFDYIPIEPIQSYKLNNTQMVDIFSGVLDLNLESWMATSNRFNTALMKQRNNILAALSKLNINHGHTHMRNFCLRFFRTKTGEIDMNKTPRLYLIDFDQAVSES